MLFTPIYQNYLWGGRRILSHFGREGPSGKVAESWELSALPEGMSLVENGPLRGLSLATLFEKEKKALLGKDPHAEQFPLLIKLIDALENLSIQVHPREGKDEKNEAWLILDAAKDAKLYLGMKESYSTHEIFERLGSKELVSMMQEVPALPGEIIYVPSGRLHAIGAGVLLLEVQQSSNVTYRVYDWERKRPLHLKEAKEAMDCHDLYQPPSSPKLLSRSKVHTQFELLRTPFFVIEKWHLFSNITYSTRPDQCEILFCTKGKNSLVPRGRTLLIPACCSSLEIKSEGSELIRIYPP